MIFAVIVIAVMAAFLLFIGSTLSQTWSLLRWKRRMEGAVVGDSEIVYILDELDYSIKRDKDGEEVSMSANRYGHRSGEPLESIRISLSVPSKTDVADALYQAYSSGALKMTIVPFDKKALPPS